MRVALNIERVGACFGGAEKYVAMLARSLCAAGHEVHVVARQVAPGQLPPEVRVHLVRLGEIPGAGWLRAYRFAAASEKLLQGESFDLVAGFMKVWHQTVYIAVGGTHPATLRYNSRRFRSALGRGLWWLTKWASPKQWVFRAMARRQFAPERMPLVIAPSRMVAEHFRQDHGVPEERIHVVYNGWDAQERPAAPAAARREFRRAHGLADDEVAVLFVARNYAMKGLDPLLEAFARVASRCPKARLIVCGSARDGGYRRRAARLGIAGQTRFLGFVERPSVCFAGCDLFAYPTFYDPCSLVVLEAMAAGLPVITTRQNGAGELMTEGREGHVIDSPWSIERFAACIERLVTDADLRGRMGAAGKLKADECTVDVRLAEVLEALTASSHRRAA